MIGQTILYPEHKRSEIENKKPCILIGFSHHIIKRYMTLYFLHILPADKKLGKKSILPIGCFTIL